MPPASSSIGLWPSRRLVTRWLRCSKVSLQTRTHKYNSGAGQAAVAAAGGAGAGGLAGARPRASALDDEQIIAHAKTFVQEVFRDQQVQSSAGDGLWNAFKFGFLPRWAAKRPAAAAPADATSTAAAAAMAAETARAAAPTQQQQQQAPAAQSGVHAVVMEAPSQHAQVYTLEQLRMRSGAAQP